MVSTASTSQPETEPAIVYPSSDGEPVAGTFAQLYAMLVTIEVLTQYLQGQVAPDVMVIFGVEPGGRDHYRIWEEGEVPSVVFEMTSQGTRSKDEVFKKTLYAQLGVQEYWLFDPKAEWLDPALQGYRLRGEEYEPISDGLSEPLQLRLVHEGQLIGFYRRDNNERLLIPGELSLALKQEALARQQAERRAEEAEQAQRQTQQQLERLQAKLQALGVDPDDIA